MSYRYFFASSRIEQDLGSLDRLPEVRILDRGSDDQVHGPVEELLQSLEQTEVVVRVLAGRLWLELQLKLHQEVDVAFARALASGCPGAEELEPADAVPSAKRFEFGPVLGEFGAHVSS